MQDTEYITVISDRKNIVIKSGEILYVLMNGKTAQLHISDGHVYETRMTLGELEQRLGDEFIKLHRGCIVSVRAIHGITDKVILNNGELLEYTLRKKKWIIDEFCAKQKQMIQSISEGEEQVPMTEEEYHQHYKSFDRLPFAFTDIEMVFDENKHAIDWIFRYGNPELAHLEKLSLENLIGNSFGNLFPSMDSKWLQNYERAALYGETLELIDYSPEIDSYLKITCFPTFPGHCGCILFDLSHIRFTKSSNQNEKALELYFGKENEKTE